MEIRAFLVNQSLALEFNWCAGKLVTCRDDQGKKFSFFHSGILLIVNKNLDYGLNNTIWFIPPDFYNGAMIGQKSPLYTRPSWWKRGGLISSANVWWIFANFGALVQNIASPRWKAYRLLKTQLCKNKLRGISPNTFHFWGHMIARLSWDR